MLNKLKEPQEAVGETRTTNGKNAVSPKSKKKTYSARCEMLVS
jgi:hypothetical protein